MSMNTSPAISVDESLLDSCAKTENMATPMVIRNASMYCDLGYTDPLSSFPMIMTGMILEDLNTVCTGKETYLSEAYCDQLLMVLERAHGVNACRGAILLLNMDPCLSLTDIMATIMARNLFEKTQNAAEGNLPSGEEAVGSNLVVMMSSCMYPQVR